MQAKYAYRFYRIYSDYNIPVQYTKWQKKISKSFFIGFTHGIWFADSEANPIFKDVREHKECDFMKGFEEGMDELYTLKGKMWEDMGFNPPGFLDRPYIVTDPEMWNEEIIKIFWKNRKARLEIGKEQKQPCNQ